MKTEKKRNLKGSVLFTVVAVLALMIIFMTSALALAAAANRRAHKSYSASQASYTARAAIDSILAAVGTDNEFAQAVAGIADGGSLSVDVGINEPSLGKITNAKITSNGATKFIFDPGKMQWVEKNILEISCDVTLSGETTHIVSHVIQDPVVKSDDGPGYLTMGGKHSANGNGGTVLGGTYLGMGVGRKKNGTNMKWSNGLEYISYDGTAGVLVTLEDKQYWTENEILPKDQNKQETPVVINGNYKVMTEMALYYTQKGKGATIWGNVTFPNNGRFYAAFTDEFKASIGSGLKFTEIPYLYVDGDFQLSSANDCIIGDKNGSIPYNLFCGTMNTKQSSNAKINANVYLLDKGATSTLQMGGSNFKSWVGSVYSGGEAYNTTGGIYSLGSVNFNGNGRLEMDGGLRIEENLTIGSNMDICVNGDVAVGGVLKLEGKKFELGTGKTVYAKDVQGPDVTANGGGGLKPGYTQGNLNYVRGKNFKYLYYNSVTGKNEEYPDDYGWLFPDVLDAYPHTDGGAGAVDFGGAVIDPKYFDSSIMHTDSPDEDNKTKVYKTNVYLNSAGKEVSSSEALNSGSGWTYAGEKGSITIKPIEDFYKDFGEPIYPPYAKREVLMGVSGPVKGTEGYISKDAAPAACNSKVYTAVSLVGNGKVTESCTLTGTWNKSVHVETKGEDIHVLLKDVNFTNADDPGDCRIYVDESKGGHVYFHFAGSVNCDYSNPSEVEGVKLFDTVKDLMEKWGIENNIDAPNPPIPDSSTLVVGQNGAYNKTSGDGFTTSGKNIKITGGTKIVCTSGNKIDGATVDVYPPSSGNLWVHLDNITAQNGLKFIIHDLDDNGKQKGGFVNFYITGQNDLDKTQIVTESFDKAAKSNLDYQIVSDPNNPALYSSKVPKERTIPAPRVNLYSSTDGTAEIHGQNDFFITAYVRAPYMDCNVNNFGNVYDDFMKSHLYYDGIKLGTMCTQGWNNAGKFCERLGIVGCFNVNDFPSENDWVLLYVKQTSDGGGNTITSADGAHTYASVDYLDY